jgi:16S rRNA (uracil1498-N3)-methyltransferase
VKSLRPSERKPSRTRIDRCFVVPAGSGDGGTIVLAGDEFHHCVRVSRARPGDLVTLLDGQGVRYEARVTRVGAREAVLEVLAREEGPRVLPVDIAVALIKAPRFDLAVEKCAELGVRGIVPFTSERCVRRPGSGDSRAWGERMRRKIVAACKQAARPTFPVFEEPVSLDALSERFPAYRAVYLADRDSSAEAPACGAAAGGPVLGIVGPEGGLSPAERGTLVSRGAIPVLLGPFRLRSETAAICLACRLLDGAEGPQGRNDPRGRAPVP